MKREGIVALWVKAFAAGISFLLAGGCVMTPRPQQELPGYAARTGAQTWAVICSGRQVFGDWNNYSAFYGEDGNQKDHDHFCDDVQTGSRILQR